jgi:hypothetical protein
MGKALDENTGAAVNMAKVRINGQNMGDIHAANCASLMEITGATR